jgi:hypothetical protein
MIADEVKSVCFVHNFVERSKLLQQGKEAPPLTSSAPPDLAVLACSIRSISLECGSVQLDGMLFGWCG